VTNALDSLEKRLAELLRSVESLLANDAAHQQRRTVLLCHLREAIRVVKCIRELDEGK